MLRNQLNAYKSKSIHGTCSKITKTLIFEMASPILMKFSLAYSYLLLHRVNILEKKETYFVISHMADS